MLRDPSLIPLSHQHQHALALCVMTRRAWSQDPSPDNLAKLARRVVDRYELELANHFGIEEQVLFPACANLSLVQELLAQHRTLESQIEQLRTAPTAELLEEFCELLSKHVRLEENELFQEAQREIPREDLDRIGSEIDRRVVRVCL